MTGQVLADVVIWAVLGAVIGWTAAAWASLRVGLALAVVVTVLGLALVLFQVGTLGADGLPAAATILLFSMPATLGLALGALAAHLIGGRR